MGFQARVRASNYGFKHSSVFQNCFFQVGFHAFVRALNGLRQGCPKAVPKGCSPARFPFVPAATQPIQMRRIVLGLLQSLLMSGSLESSALQQGAMEITQDRSWTCLVEGFKQGSGSQDRVVVSK